MSDTILISGKQGSGKSTLSRILRDIFINDGHLVHQFKFADPLYEMHTAVLKVALQYKLPLADTVKNGPLLQLLGTDWGRKELGNDVWINALKTRIKRMEKMPTFSYDVEDPSRRIFIVDDCRFKNELYAFPDAFKVRLECEPEIRKARTQSWRENTDHPSETDLDDVPRTDFNAVYLTSSNGTHTVAAWAFDLFTEWKTKRDD